MARPVDESEITYHRYSGKHALLPAILKLASWGFFRPRPGNYYSPVPAAKDIEKDAARIFDLSLREIPGIDFDVDGQLAFLKEISQFYAEQPFTAEASDGLRFFFNNAFYGYTDSIFLYCMLRFLRPKRVIEIGSGFSSFVLLDTNERFLDNSMQLKFIDPDPRRLKSRLKPRDYQNSQVIEARVQDVDLSVFGELEAGDILFVDSSHVAKAGSDVNHILFQILPVLAKGVYVHFHDVHYPFEYPRATIAWGFYWNEAYMLRAFLQYNSNFKIRLWNDFVLKFHSAWLKEFMPLAAIPVVIGIDGSLWVQRV